MCNNIYVLCFIQSVFEIFEQTSYSLADYAVGTVFFLLGVANVMFWLDMSLFI